MADADNPFVTFYVAHPEMVENALAKHVANGHGDCKGCWSALSSTKWPCVHVWHAEGARRLLSERHRRHQRLPTNL